MKNSTKKIVIISVVLIVLGLILFGSAFLTSGGKIGANLTRTGWKSIYSGNIELPKQVVEDFNNIDLKLKNRDIKLVPSDSFAIEIYQKDNMEYGVKNGILTMVDNNRKNIDILNFNIMAESDAQKKVTIYYKEGTEFGSINLSNNGCSIDISQIKATNMEFNNKFSAGVLREINVTNLDIKDNSSAYTFENVTSDSLNLDLEFGALDMDNVTIKNATTIKGKNTAVSLQNFVSDSLDISNKFAATEIENIKTNGINFNGEQSSLSIDGVVSGNIDVNTSFGSVDIDLDGNKADYQIISDVEFGEVETNGSGYGSENSKYKLNIVCKSANVTLNVS